MFSNNRNNSFSVMGNNEAMKDFYESTIKSCNTVIEHYDFVIRDISSEISNPQLQTTKGPALRFLKEMRNEWLLFRNDMQKQLENETKA